jgi:AraC-like DNA-binding protein
MADAISDGAVAAPSARLRPYIAHYSGYRLAGVEPGRHRGLPSPYLTLILTLDDPLMLAAHPDPSQQPASYDALVGGLHTRPATIVHDGRQSGVQVSLHPLGAPVLLGVPAGELAGADLPLDAVLGAAAEPLRATLLEEPTWPARFRRLNRAFEQLMDGGPGRSRVDRAGRDTPELAEAWRLLRRTGGRIAVRDLAHHVGWGERHLLDRFRRDVGLTPSQVARVVRFDLARRRLFGTARSGALPCLADLAADHGYFDQAHLAREFRDLAGCSPTRLLAEELRFVQASPWPGDEDLVP